MLFQYYFENPVLKTSGGLIKYESTCPFCSHLRGKPSKQRARCAALTWTPSRKTWTFNCFNGGTTTCSSSAPGAPVDLLRLLKVLNPGLHVQYQRERFHAGTTGGRFNCSDPEVLKRFQGPPAFKSKSKSKSPAQPLHPGRSESGGQFLNCLES